MKWPTPCAADGKDQASGDLYARINRCGRQRHRQTTGKGAAGGGQRRGQLTDPDMGVIEAGGQLNPDWVEWLMNWPIGWSSLEPMSKETFNEWLHHPDWFAKEPDGIPRVSKGVPNRTNRLKAIGNGQVPSCAALAWRVLSED